MKTRRSGILLHITSLPSPYGIGDLGKGAYLFADFLHESGQSIWQVLPLNPSSMIYGNSPYSSCSVFAGNPLLISPELLVEEGLIAHEYLDNLPAFLDRQVEYQPAAEHKYRLLGLAFEKFKSDNFLMRCEFDKFCVENERWLEDYALFVSLKEEFGGVAWSEWPREVREREERSLAEWRQRLADKIFQEKFYQYLFFKQWFALKRYCNEKRIQIVGDMPIYTSYDSADVWLHPGLFKLDEEKRPRFVAGVPPDYFSSTGQLWGNPVYDWDRLRDTRYDWWVDRIQHNIKLFDLIRFDHFRGFVEYWEIPAKEKTAVNGKWVPVPVKDFFDSLLRRFAHLPIIAEDLGIITPDVREVMTGYDLHGMKVLQFAFGDDVAVNPYAPHNHTPNCFVYTGTHDNNTTRGWFRTEAGEDEKNRLFSYIGRVVDEEEIHWEVLRLAMRSVALTAIAPMQDVLGLGEEARMNLPSVTYGNWEWRLVREQMTPALAEKLGEMSSLYGRI
ncbi:4-alpha-glucanotransferase [Desulforhabdus amnigena]|jgi:4-alpha-glucanotransferase|uniref:4-alpha-glucanotransferase n=1 Tax=Desulforhabdus amnigena TaxID=40218 RepID=A0A9W6L8T0_9BACT|nr:4-alpha-glucanotransferase [Desulforhabdus amnigena]NLJ26760.1 4-alpha-glucanotransferase [Deltaproteobacteria bacterium]GLI35982.1 4-alpha-glucanotransferase [Desulforhabdus amnigena]